MIGGMVDWLEPYHPALALRSGAAGLVVAVVVVAATAAGRTGRLGRLAVGIGVAAASAVLWAVWEAAIPRPVGLVVAGAIVVAVACSGTPDDRAVPAMVWWSLVGVWAAVPDTEPALTIAAFLTPAVVWATCRRVGPAGRAVDRGVGVALVVLTAWAGSAGRSEIVGGLACVGLLVVPVRVPPIRTLPGVTVAAIHVVLVVTASRVVTTLGRVPATIAAVALVVSGGVAALAISANSVSPPGGPAGRTPGRPERRR